MEPALTRTSFEAESFCGLEIGNYLLHRQLGLGGYAHVYLAEHLYLQNRVALKVLNPSFVHHEELQHFLQASLSGRFPRSIYSSVTRFADPYP